MIIIRQGCLTHFINLNKSIYFLHQYLIYISNAQVIKISKLVYNINRGLSEKEYNLVKVFINFNNLKISDIEKINFLAIFLIPRSLTQIAN